MTYSRNHPIRLVAGRLALDFLNTADWTADGRVTHEKIAAPPDLAAWLAAVGLPDATWPGSIADFHASRCALRRVFLNPAANPTLLAGATLLAATSLTDLRRQPLDCLVAVSALAILADPRELSRVKLCPGTDCGWLFLDETRNARRKWCMMETCGNRAKAARHYARQARAS